MSDEELFGMYNDKSLVGLISATRGEGYGLPMIEAAAAGLPVMATDWSGHKTFLQDGCWLPVNYELKQIVPERVDSRIFMDRSMWAYPLEQSFKDSLQKLYNDRNVYRQKCLKSRNAILDNFCESKLQTEYDKFLEENL
jgi:glycosyltransferase involved in cell wall biosynthesis